MSKISASLRNASTKSGLDSTNAKVSAATSTSFTNTTSQEILRLSGKGASFSKGDYTSVKIAVEEGGPVVITSIIINTSIGELELWNSSSGRTIEHEFHFKQDGTRSKRGTFTNVIIKGYDASSSGGGGSGGGSGGDTTPSISGSAIFPSTGTFTQTITLGVTFYISFSNCDYIRASLYDTISGETIAESGAITGG